MFPVDLAAMNPVQEESAPGYFDPLPERLRSSGLAQAQWDWIEAQMKASTADYLIVAGHYPVCYQLHLPLPLNAYHQCRPLYVVIPQLY